MAINSTRRYYLLKRLDYRERCIEEDPWKSKQEGEPATALPADFPHSAELAAAGYTAIEDIDGSTVAELRRFCSLTSREAEKVLAALAAL